MSAALVPCKIATEVTNHSWDGLTYLLVSVLAIASASVAISDIPLLLVLAKSGVCNIILVPSYCNICTLLALITQSCGSLPYCVFMFFAHNEFKLSVHAPVLAVVNLHTTNIHVLYAVGAGVNDAVYVSLPVDELAYTQLPSCIILANTSGVITRFAPVPPVTVHANHSTDVAVSTLPATVVLEFACVLPADTADHAHPIY